MEPKRYDLVMTDIGHEMAERDEGEYVRYNDPAIVLALRKAKAFDAIAAVDVLYRSAFDSRGRLTGEWEASVKPRYNSWHQNSDLLTAIEEAIKCDTQP